MIDEIFEMIMKEARRRKGPSLEVDIMIVLLEVTNKVFDAWKTTRLEDIKKTRLTFRRKEP